MFVLQVTKSEANATGGDNAESLAEDLLKRFSDTQPEVKKEPISSKFIAFYQIYTGCEKHRTRHCGDTWGKVHVQQWTSFG